MARQGYGHTSIDDAFGIIGPGRLSEQYVGTDGDDTLVGSSGSDNFFLSQGGSDRVTAGGGDDYVSFGDAFDPTDIADGGAGFDSVYLEGHYTGTTVSDTMLIGFERAYLYLIDASRLAFSGFSPATLFPELLVGSRDDTISSIDASLLLHKLDVHVGGFTSLDLIGTGLSDTLNIDSYITTNITFDGGRGSDWISLSYFVKPMHVDLSDTAPQAVGNGTLSLSNVENIEGSIRSDILVGSNVANQISGGGGGSDHLFGLDGDDLLIIGSFSEKKLARHGSVDGGTGRDLIMFVYGQSDDLTLSLATNRYQDTGHGVYKLTNVEDVFATFDDDFVTGSKDNNCLLGDYGDDHLVGGGGDDVLAGAGYVDSYSHDDPVYVYTSRSGDDREVNDLDGQSGNDILYGGDGADVLVGGTGADLLYGQGGRDQFIFASTTDSRPRTPDTIADFSAGDLIDVSAIDAKATVDGDQKFHLGATAGHAGDIVVAFDAARGVTVVDLYVDGDARPDMTINLTGNIALTDADFVL